MTFCKFQGRYQSQMASLLNILKQCWKKNVCQGIENELFFYFFLTKTARQTKKQISDHYLVIISKAHENPCNGRLTTSLYGIPILRKSLPILPINYLVLFSCLCLDFFSLSYHQMCLIVSLIIHLERQCFHAITYLPFRLIQSLGYSNDFNHGKMKE